AESLVGNGFPYPIEVADSVAVIQKVEKELFIETYEKKFQKDGQSNLSFKQKSKNLRRKAKFSF
ncbi:MAG TPA: hypothetical protein V6C96_04445, partial [Vampirovibrionales bacterium]